MTYINYLVYHAKGTSEEVSVAVYEKDEETAAEVGTYLLNKFYSTSYTTSDVDVLVIEGLTSDSMTTT